MSGMLDWLPVLQVDVLSRTLDWFVRLFVGYEHIILRSILSSLILIQSVPPGDWITKKRQTNNMLYKMHKQIKNYFPSYRTLHYDLICMRCFTKTLYLTCVSTSWQKHFACRKLLTFELRKHHCLRCSLTSAKHPSCAKSSKIHTRSKPRESWTTARNLLPGLFPV